MPTAADYRRAAVVFRRHSAEFADDARHRRLQGDVAFVGPLADAHADAMTAIAADRGRAAETLRFLAVVCDRRAEVCEEYAHQLARWREHVSGHRGRAARRPEPPEPWVDV